MGNSLPPLPQKNACSQKNSTTFNVFVMQKLFTLNIYKNVPMRFDYSKKKRTDQNCRPTTFYLSGLSHWSNITFAISPSNKAIYHLWTKQIHLCNVILNVAISRQYNMRIARWYIAVDECDFCSQLIDFVQFGVLFKVLAIIVIANWLRLVKKFIKKIFGSFNDEASDFWNFPPTPLILIN